MNGYILLRLSSNYWLPYGLGDSNRYLISSALFWSYNVTATAFIIIILLSCYSIIPRKDLNEIMQFIQKERILDCKYVTNKSNRLKNRQDSFIDRKYQMSTIQFWKALI